MSQSFTPAAAFSANERDWQAEIGLLPWSTSIVFTKESLVRFLKQLEVEVDTNMSQLKKLPKYAAFGTMAADAASTGAPAPAPAAAPTRAAPAEVASSADAPVFIPTRKVREQPGGGSTQIASLLAGDPADDHANWVPPPIPTAPQAQATEPTPPQVIADASIEAQPSRAVMPDGTAFVPTRKVREPTGGYSSMGAILSGN